MGRVCKPWRHLITERLPLTRRQGLPWLVLTAHNQYQERPCFSILQKNIWNLQVPDALGKYCWGSIQDWLIIANKCGSSLEIYLLNPFSTAKLHLPSITDRYTKMILSASPDDPNCLFLLVGIRYQSIACWTPGVKTWRIMDTLDNEAGAFADAVFCDGRFYFVNHDYNIQTLDAQPLISAMKQDKDCTGDIKLHLHPHQVTIPERPTWPDDPVRPYLVESCGEVLMVCRLFLTLSGTDRETHGFEVFKLDARQMLVWRKMQGLSDRVLFIGKSDSRSFSAKDLGDDAANHIYFFNDFFTFGVNEWTKSALDTTTPIRRSTFMDWGSFSIDTKCFFPTGSNRGSHQTYPPIWITAPIWWFYSDFSK